MEALDLIAPIRSGTRRWEGSLTKKPWDYQVCAAIPVLGSPEIISICIEILRHQTERPYIVLIDTGSTPDEFADIESLRAEDCEVHAIRVHGMIHPADVIASAMDLAFSICRSSYLFATHADCFLKRRDVLAEMLELCQTKSPIVGYKISPRRFPEWRWMFGHTCTMFDMEAMDRIGAYWSQRRLCLWKAHSNRRHSPTRPGWPDTELLINYIARDHGITPHFIGSERNYMRNEDDRIDHFRSYTSSMLYAQKHHAKTVAWAEDAIAKARERLKEWGEIQ